jgi:RHS repeat-associated protein
MSKGCAATLKRHEAMSKRCAATLTAPARARAGRPLLAACLWLAAILCAPAAFAQGSTPQRGFQPAGSYAFGDFETINTKNGNMLLNFPLGKLPAGRGGLSGGISLVYNSKIFDTYVQFEEDCRYYPCQLVQKEVLRPSTEGGWQYVVGYEVQVIDRMEQYLSWGEGRPKCPDEQFTYVYKVRVKFPDGSVHDLKTDAASWGGYSGDGYSDVRFDGVQKYCRVTATWPDYQYVEDYRLPPGITGRSFYTTDGTYARLDVTYDGDFTWQNNTWTLHLPDGTRVVNTNGVQLIYDRNNNHIQISHVANYNGTGQPARIVSDSVGRSVALQHDAAAGADLITSQGFGQSLTWRVTWKAVRLNKTYIAAEGPYGNLTDFIHDLYVVDKIILPAQAGGLEYKFDYNAPDSPGGWSTTPVSVGWGEVNSITLPTGARAAYQYAHDGRNADIRSWEILDDMPTRKDVIYRQEHDLAGPVSNTPCNPSAETCATETWTYGPAPDHIGFAITAPDGGMTIDADGAYGNQRDRHIAPDGTKIERIRAYNPPPGTFQPQWAAMNSYVKQEFVSVRNAAGTYVKTAIKEYDQDKNGNVTRVREYDWVPYGDVARNVYDQPTGAIPPSAVLKRVTVNDYWVPSPDASDNTNNYGFTYNQTYYEGVGGAPTLLGAIKSTEIRTGPADWQAVARAEFYYDDPLYRGNLTVKKFWDSARGPLTRPLSDAYSAVTSQQYDAHGNPTLSTDARGTRTLLVYGPVGGHGALYPTESRAAYGTSVEQLTTTEYDFSTGLVTRTTDQNGVATTATYDVLGRPTLVRAAEGRPEETRTQTSYSDSARRVVTRADLSATGDGKLVSVVHYDQLGRVRLARQLEDSATQSEADETHGVKVQTRHLYSGPNSYRVVSNPYRAAYSHQAAGETSMGWSRTKSDNAGRVVEEQTFAGAGLPAPWGANAAGTGAVTTAYDAESTTVTDQAGRARRDVGDAFGRLARVDEPDAGGNLGPASAPAQPTHYSYDVLGNLVQVTQGQQTRTFTYSSLSRLLSAANPESGLVSYAYDPGGNLLTKTDARGVTVSYAYDALGRNTAVDYLNTPTSPDITRYYDNPAAGAHGRGLFWHDYKGDPAGGGEVEHRAVDAYDALGRPLVQRQLFKTNWSWGPTYQTSRAYNRAGGVVSQTYPSGRTASYAYDGAGRLAAFNGNLGDGVQRTYAAGIEYDAGSRVSQEQFGTQVPLYHKRAYNVRGQLYDVRLSTHSQQAAPWNWNRGALINYYSQNDLNAQTNEARAATGPGNNGNVVLQQHWVPANDQISGYNWTNQWYAYDSLNRLTSVQEQQSGAHTGAQAYAYDRFGNRQINSAATWGAGINNRQFAVDAATNRLGVPAGQAGVMQYDPAGNLTFDSYTGHGSRTYDAENRMTSAQGYSALTSVYTNQYSYDADGRRTRRKLESGEVWAVYGMGGELLAEYPAGGSPSQPRREYGYRAGELLVAAQPGDQPQFTAFVAAFYQAVLNRQPTSAESQQRVATLAAASDQGQSAFFDAASAMGRSLFQSQEYAARGRADHWFVYDLYVAFLAREPDAGGWAAWESAVASQGRGPILDIFSSAGNGEWANRAASVARPLRWLVSDHLGTPRMTADQTGSLSGIRRHDYLPFGEELGAGAGGRTAAQGYSPPDGVRQGFTGYEKDGETGLDFAQARYYSNVQGRFTGTDPENAGAVQGLPQSWNGYAYVLNNPLSLVDPSGTIWLQSQKHGYFIWVPNEEYKPEDYKDYNEMLDGSVIEVAGVSGQYSQFAHLVGRYATLNADGTLSAAPDETIQITAKVSSCLYCEDLIDEMAKRGPAMEKMILGVTALNLAPAVVATTGLSGGGLTTLGIAGGAKKAVTKIDDILKGAAKGKVSKSIQYSKPGGFAQANKDFDALTQGANVVNRGNGLRTAQLPDGTKVNVRPFSSGNKVTLEIQPPSGKVVKIRYD